MKKLLPIIITAVVSLLIGIGGTLGVTMLMHSAAKPGGPQAAVKVQAEAKPKPKKILFAELSDVTASLPPEAGAPATSYVSLTMKFQTSDPAVLIAYAEVEPIIKAAIITRLMNETSATLQEQGARNDFLRATLTIANNVIAQDGNLTQQEKAFSAAYITNLVTQN